LDEDPLVPLDEDLPAETPTSYQQQKGKTKERLQRDVKSPIYFLGWASLVITVVYLLGALIFSVFLVVRALLLSVSLDQKIFAAATFWVSLEFPRYKAALSGFESFAWSWCIHPAWFYFVVFVLASIAAIFSFIPVSFLIYPKEQAGAISTLRNKIDEWTVMRKLKEKNVYIFARPFQNAIVALTIVIWYNFVGVHSLIFLIALFLLVFALMTFYTIWELMITEQEKRSVEEEEKKSVSEQKKADKQPKIVERILRIAPFIFVFWLIGFIVILSAHLIYSLLVMVGAKVNGANLVQKFGFIQWIIITVLEWFQFVVLLVIVTARWLTKIIVEIENRRQSLTLLHSLVKTINEWRAKIPFLEDVLRIGLVHGIFLISVLLLIVVGALTGSINEKC
jgi:hypothetical protein